MAINNQVTLRRKRTALHSKIFQRAPRGVDHVVRLHSCAMSTTNREISPITPGRPGPRGLLKPDFLGNQALMPPHKGIRRNNGIECQQRFTFPLPSLHRK